MNKLGALLTYCALSISCATLNKETIKKSQSLDQLTEMASNKENYSSNEAHVRIIRANDEENLITEIVPTGVFSYSPNEGFSGAAVSITIKGKRNAIVETLEANKFEKHQQQSTQIKNQKSSTKIQHQNHRFKFGVDFYLYLALAIFLAILWCWWRYK